MGSTYVITLLPNRMHYKTVEEAMHDFDFQCGVGALRPISLNADWIVMGQGCGGVSEGCGVMEAAVEPTIQLR